MKKMVIATHGKLAEGFRNTLDILGIALDHISAMNFYCGETCGEKEVKQCFDDLKQGEQLIICTDIQFGSVNQMFLKEAARRNVIDVFIITGVNLPLLLEIATSTSPLTKVELTTMVQKAANQLTLVDFEEMKANLKDEDIF